MKLYNTITRKVENFTPINGKKINLFVCGPTVYDDVHLGHAKTYTQMDVLARTLRQLGYDVFYLQNITDLDDKIIVRAQERGLSWDELRSQYEERFYKDMKALQNVAVNKYARATDHIEDIIKQVQKLLDKKHAYIIDDGIYFEVATFPEYGKLSGRQEVQEDDAQTRVDHSDQKRGWNDFCLWKFSKPGEPTWDAPFGKGRPGWHIEDTAITEHFFGPQYDIHGGAIDLIFPHHEAEITQMEAASGKVPFVKYWIHVGFLNIDSVKMSKSKGNFFTVRQVIEKGHDPIAIRLLMLQSQYRSSVNFSWDLLAAAQNRLHDYHAMADQQWQASQHAKVGDSEIKAAKDDMLKALTDDLNTPEALAHLSRLQAVVESDGVKTSSSTNYKAFLKWLDELLGLQLADREEISAEQKQLIAERQKARQAKDWKKSDELRNQLKEQGVELRDTPQGPIWQRL